MNTCPRQYLSLSSVLGSCRKVEGDLYCDPLSFLYGVYEVELTLFQVGRESFCIFSFYFTLCTFLFVTIQNVVAPIIRIASTAKISCPESRLPFS